MKVFQAVKEFLEPYLDSAFIPKVVSFATFHTSYCYLLQTVEHSDYSIISLAVYKQPLHQDLMKHTDVRD